MHENKISWNESIHIWDSFRESHDPPVKNISLKPDFWNKHIILKWLEWVQMVNNNPEINTIRPIRV